MSESDYVHSLLVYGVAAAKANDKENARFHLNKVLYQIDASLEQKCEAWWWLSQIAESPLEKREYLQNILIVDSTEPRARREMAIFAGRLKPEDVLGPHEPARSVATPVTLSDSRLHRFACPRCGGKMTHQSSQQALCCSQCGYQTEPSLVANGTRAIEEKDFYADLPTLRGRCWELPSSRCLKCQGCGVIFVMPESGMAASCPYCESVYALQTVENPDLIQPQGVLPFQQSADMATRHSRDYLQACASGAAGVALANALEHPRGLYVPFWTFDIRGQLKWRRELIKQDHPGWSMLMGSDENCTQEEESGSYPIDYDDLLIPASSLLPSDLLKRVADFDTTALVPYSIDLLADWTTEIYQVSLDRASAQAHQHAYERAKTEFLNTLSPFQNFLPVNFSSTDISIDTYKLVLLPVWKIRGAFENRHFTVLVNGQTATVAGEASQ